MNTVRDALNVVRYDWFGLRIGGRGASMRGLWPVLTVVSVLIFGGFFALGRMTTGGAPAPETSSSQRIAHAAIPGGLHGGSPVAGSVPNAITTPPVRRVRTPAVAETPAIQSGAGANSGTSAPSVVSQPESAPAPTPVPAQASAPPTQSSGSGSAGQRSSGSGAGGSGGGSFDSSG
ncbi:MAG TPA: hypothetical protein VGI52_08235 [Solirubrobacteraceae bacterium]|jgi:uncharacterized membrane protein YgcG